jgi:hypothetical protein
MTLALRYTNPNLCKVIAVRFAKISQQVYRAVVHHVPQFGESLIGRQIGVNNHSSNVFRILAGGG